MVGFDFQWNNPGIYAKCRVNAWVPLDDREPIDITGVLVEELGSLGNRFAIEISNEQMDGLGEQMMALINGGKLDGLREDVAEFIHQNDGLNAIGTVQHAD